MSSPTNQQAQYYLDMVFCIDGTGSMGGVIDGVKSFCSGMSTAVEEALSDEGKFVDKMRLKIIVFRDFAEDGGDALEILDFRDPSDSTESTEIMTFINNIKAEGGGDEPENSLEALALAMNSDWSSEGTKGRQLVMLFTDAPPHPFNSVDGPAKPTDLPATEDELTKLWADKQAADKKMIWNRQRLFLFVPTGDPAWQKWMTQDLAGGMDIGKIAANPDKVREAMMKVIVASVS